MKECELCHGTGYIIKKSKGYPRFERKKCPKCKGRGTIFEALTRLEF